MNTHTQTHTPELNRTLAQRLNGVGFYIQRCIKGYYREYTGEQLYGYIMVHYDVVDRAL